MFALKKMTKEMHDEVLAMVEEFYHSDAVFVLTEDGKTVGFAYITEYYACEVGGRCLMFEELYLKEATRGKGYGTRFFDEIMKAKPEVRRFRLEVTRSNEKAVRLYERLGFTFLDYDQMILDR